MKKLLFAIIALSISLTTLSAQERVIEREALPKVSQKFIATHFPTDKVAIATMEKDGLGREYKVIMTSGTKIEFDTKGNWTDVECKRKNAVPKAIIPSYIAKYVGAKFPAQSIVGIEQSKRGVDVELSNGIELEFNSRGQLVEIDK
ncbi:MAG: PepSY-like domain-containing protein [Rikenellaceae bacterium]